MQNTIDSKEETHGRQETEEKKGNAIKIDFNPVKKKNEKNPSNGRREAKRTELASIVESAAASSTQTRTQNAESKSEKKRHTHTHKTATSTRRDGREMTPDDAQQQNVVASRDPQKKTKRNKESKTRKKKHCV